MLVCCAEHNDTLRIAAYRAMLRAGSRAVIWVAVFNVLVQLVKSELHHEYHTGTSNFFKCGPAPLVKPA